MEQSGVQLITCIVFGVICALLAKSRGRNAVGWFFIGALFSCFAVVVLLVIPNLEEQREREQRLELENQRLRERLSKDRQVADQRHAETGQRLAVHDRALGVDTAPELAGPAQSATALEEGRRDGTSAAWRAVDWHYVRDATAVGPIDFDELRRLWRAGAVGASTLVWTEAIENWRALGEVPELEGALRG